MVFMNKKDDFNFEWLPGFREMMACQNDEMAGGSKQDDNSNRTMLDSGIQSNDFNRTIPDSGIQSNDSNRTIPDSGIQSSDSSGMMSGNSSQSNNSNSTMPDTNDNDSNRDSNKNSNNSNNNISNNTIWQGNLIQNNANQMLPPEQLQQEEQQYWKDYEYLIQLLPMVAREVWVVADALLDQYEYPGSSIYSEYPDKVTILKIVDMVYDKLKYREEQEMIQTNDEAMIRNPYFIEVSLRDGNSPFRTLIQVVLHWNINHRRQRYYRRQKVFSNR